MKRRYYFDTSVFGGVFDDEFKNESLQLFEQVKAGRVICLYSEIVENELRKAPAKVRAFAESIDPGVIEKLSLSFAVKDLANSYISANIVGRKSYEDCLHIAFATIYEADVLVSWNLKHIVNTNKIKAYNSIKLNAGYKEIKICSPKNLNDHES